MSQSGCLPLLALITVEVAPLPFSLKPGVKLLLGTLSLSLSLLVSLNESVRVAQCRPLFLLLALRFCSS